MLESIGLFVVQPPTNQAPHAKIITITPQLKEVNINKSVAYLVPNAQQTQQSASVYK